MGLLAEAVGFALKAHVPALKQTSGDSGATERAADVEDFEKPHQYLSCFKPAA